MLSILLLNTFGLCSLSSVLYPLFPVVKFSKLTSHCPAVPLSKIHSAKLPEVLFKSLILIMSLPCFKSTAALPLHTGESLTPRRRSWLWPCGSTGLFSDIPRHSPNDHSHASHTPSPAHAGHFHLGPCVLWLPLPRMPSLFQLMNLFSFLPERALFPTWTSIQRVSINFHGTGRSPEKTPQLVLPSLASSGTARVGGHHTFWWAADCFA